MSIVGNYNSDTRELEPLEIELKESTGLKKKSVPIDYAPTEEEKAVRSMVLKHFQLGYLNMYTPRVELNDLSVIQRVMVDQQAFNTYQANNGQPFPSDPTSWHSRALRPVVRNKVISIAAHATARLIFPHIIAYNSNNETQKDAAQVMEDLMQFLGEQSDYALTALYAVISALVNPASIVFTEHNEIFRKVKREQLPDGSYREETIIDDIFSGQKNVVVSPDELFIENFFEPDIQKQSWLIWRRVISYDTAKELFGDQKNFKYVNPGMQILYSDANATFYQVYDYNMRPYMVEWVRYWNRNLDLMVDVVNGILLSPYNQPNPRMDKKYPFAKFGYEIINNRCFYYKSTAFKLMQDANIINTLYPMVIDRSYLDLFPAMILQGGELEDQNVIVPGKTTTLTDPNSKLSPIITNSDLRSGLLAAEQVEKSLNESSELPVSPEGRGKETAYEISKREQERNTVLGLFVQMIQSFVRQLGELWVSDALQYLTVADLNQLSGDSELVFKTFIVPKTEHGKSKIKKVSFDNSLPDTMTEKEALMKSMDVLDKQGGIDSETELALVNPALFRELKFKVLVSPDVMNPLSEEVERAFNLELYDRMVNNQNANQEATLELLLSSTPTTKKDPKKYLAQQNQQQAQRPPINMANQQLPQPANPLNFNPQLFKPQTL